ncbi:hypothetical protein HA052_04155 [Chromobacterium haemolyticum]|uniref:Uncharacterized protein n=1 Tax=Chromobacterium fluminis TaxID=3044269 RepID=A0ABX0L5P6_9NEIS|nr:hypothetical protein [Chromobacterium haemolyticum]NHR04383.1 hypothetical protein [Chromobacterium haemolyticum]
MAEVILHNAGAYNLYNTISDGAHFVSALTLDQLRYYIQREYGDAGLKALPARLERAHTTGTSDPEAESLEEFLISNQAGANGETLSCADFVQKFLTIVPTA